MVLGKYLFFSIHNMDIYDKLKAIQIMIDNNEITDDDVPYIQLVLKNMQNDVQTMIKKGDLEQLVSKTNPKKLLTKVEKNKSLSKKVDKTMNSKKSITRKNTRSKKVQSGGAEEQPLEEDDSDEMDQKIIEESASQILNDKLKQIENLYSFNDKNDTVIKESIDSILTKEIEKLGNRGQPPNENNIVSNQYVESSNLPGCFIS